MTSRTTTVRTVAPAPAPPPAGPGSSASQSAVAPVVDLTATPASQPAAASKRPTGTDEMLPIAGGALALLALGGAALAVSRRRREDAWHGEWEEAPTTEPAAANSPAEPRHDPIVQAEQPEIVQPSAFSWGATAPPRQTGRDAGDDRLPGETWVQRAYRGPSDNNPSVSLKNRLRRAAFFDKRERDVAAGLAEPVEPGAGLPDARADEREGELA